MPTVPKRREDGVTAMSDTAECHALLREAFDMPAEQIDVWQKNNGAIEVGMRPPFSPKGLDAIESSAELGIATWEE